MLGLDTLLIVPLYIFQKIQRLVYLYTLSLHIYQMKKSYQYLTILLVIGAFLPLIYQFILSTPKDNQELFTEHFTPLHLLDESQWRGDRNNALPEENNPEIEAGKTLYQQAVQAYQNEDFTQAIQQFEAYQSKNIKHDRNYHLYLGIAYLATERLDDAQATFEKALNHVSSVKKGDAEWYLVLTLIRKNALDQAKQRLQTLVARVEHPRHKQAVQLQRQIQHQTS